MSDPDVSCDSLLQGSLTLCQPARGSGYRFNLDSVLLANFAASGHRVVDLGAGCGVLGLLMLKLGKAAHVTFVERQPTLAALCRRNIKENGFCDQATVVEGDLREVPLEGFDGAVFNPPYFKAGSGRPSVTPGRDEGRYERHGGLEDFLEAALRATGSQKNIGVVFRHERRGELLELAKARGLRPSRERLVHARRGKPARQVLLELGAEGHSEGEGGAPLYVHVETGGREYSREVAGMLGHREGDEIPGT